MPTLAEITAASSTITSIARAQTIALVRSSARYIANPGRYPGLESRIDSVTTVQAQQINAALAGIDSVGDGTVGITGGEDAVDYSQSRDREQLLDYIISVLYDSPAISPPIAVSQMNAVRSRASCCSVCGLVAVSCCCH